MPKSVQGNLFTQDMTPEQIVIVPSALCHTYFPYTNPGDDKDFHYKQQGNYYLSVTAHRQLNPATKKYEFLGLPYGPKPRLILAVLNTIALKTKSLEFNVTESFTKFIGNSLHLPTHGRSINMVKEQMARLAAADIQITYLVSPTRTRSEEWRFIRGFDLFWDKENMGVWGNDLRFSADYFELIQEHGVPLDMRVLEQLAHKAMAIDLYSFLAHRLHGLSKPVNVTWKAMQDQFGSGYKLMKHFKYDFRDCLKLVKTLYPEAKIEEVQNEYFILSPSKPSVPAKTYILIS